eukprot:gene37209-50205_t
MLGLIVVVIMMGFPTAFTLMGLGMFFGFFAYYRAGEAWADNHIFDLMVQRTYGAMTNDVLISIPLFVLMGYVMERGALVDKMFYSIQLAFRRVPASLAVATLIVCTFWGIASGGRLADEQMVGDGEIGDRARRDGAAARLDAPGAIEQQHAAPGARQIGRGGGRHAVASIGADRITRAAPTASAAATRNSIASTVKTSAKMAAEIDPDRADEPARAEGDRLRGSPNAHANSLAAWPGGAGELHHRADRGDREHAIGETEQEDIGPQRPGGPDMRGKGETGERQPRTEAAAEDPAPLSPSA